MGMALCYRVGVRVLHLPLKHLPGGTCAGVQGSAWRAPSDILAGTGTDLPSQLLVAHGTCAWTTEVLLQVSTHLKLGHRGIGCCGLVLAFAANHVAPPAAIGAAVARPSLVRRIALAQAM